MALIAYATLYPWSGWHWPDRQVFSWLLPKLGNEVPSDLVSNILGYLPLGLILCVAHLRSQRGPVAAALLAVASASVLSYTLELVQFTVPTRVPSITDWALNTLGAAWGALAAVTLDSLGLVDAWHRLRERWFIPQAGHGLALLWLWPLGLLFPPPLPLGEGQLLPHVRIALMEWTHDTPLQAWLLPEDPLQLWAQVHASVNQSAWALPIEALTVAAGLLSPLCVACALTQARALRVVLLALLVCTGVAVTAASTALNFGPLHAFTWLTLPTSVGLLVGALLGALLVGRTRRTAVVCGILAVLSLIGLIHLAPPDPYYAQTLQAWENGRFIRFHGLSRWFGIGWPYVALLWLLSRGWGREPTAPGASA